jgi:hypothetical protein
MSLRSDLTFSLTPSTHERREERDVRLTMTPTCENTGLPEGNPPLVRQMGEFKCSTIR